MGRGTSPIVVRKEVAMLNFLLSLFGIEYPKRRAHDKKTAEP